jgi:hypothetical protein
MTTFTTEDRIIAEKDGSLTINVNAGEVTASPPHIVDSGASVMNNEPVAYVDPIWMDRPDLVMSHQLEIGKLFARTQFTNYVPLYTHPAKTLTDEEILETVKDHFIGAIKIGIVLTNDNVLNFARAILKKAQDK